jgi:hypothetical protein
MRIRLLLVTATLTALSMVVASPASALTHAEAVRGLLLPNELGKAWHKVDVSAGGANAFDGCPSAAYTKKGVDAKAARAFQFRSSTTFVTEKLTAFDTVRLAQRDFRKGVQLYTACDSFTAHGATFNIHRVRLGDFADQRAGFRFRGTVDTSEGAVPMTVFRITTRWGHHVIVSTMVVSGALNAEQTREVKKSTVRVAKVATERVDIQLGR